MDIQELRRQLGQVLDPQTSDERALVDQLSLWLGSADLRSLLEMLWRLNDRV